MKSLPMPTIEHRNLFNVCAAQTASSSDRATLLAMADRIVASGEDYRAAAVAGRLDQVHAMYMSAGESALTSKLYDARLVRKIGAGRWAYDEIFSSVDICPYCAIGEVYEIDHFLPKGKFIDLNVLPANLIPICHPCNHIKLDRVPEGEDEYLLHPYFDALPANVRWLFADLSIEAGGPVLSFYVNLDRNQYGVIAQRLSYHFQKLDLERRFRRFAASLLVDLEAEIIDHLAVLGPEKMASHFEDLGNLTFQRHGNCLEAAAYFAAAASDEYCSGGYQS